MTDRSVRQGRLFGLGLVSVVSGLVSAGMAGPVAAWAPDAPLPRGEAAKGETPKVVGCSPDLADVVDPGLAELTIEFDQAMGPGQSLCGGGQSFPVLTIAGAKWTSPTRYVVPWKLEAGKTYAFSVNCAGGQNFKSAGGVPAEVYSIVFRTARAGETVPSLTAEQAANAVATLREAIDERYSHRDVRKVDWAAEFARWDAELKAARTPSALARAVAKLLAPAQDLHLNIQCGELPIPTHRRSVTPNYNVPGLSKLVPAWTKHNNNVASGRFEDGIGYILIGSWDTGIRGQLEVLPGILATFADAPGMVIDVRMNGGGNEELARAFAARFVEERKVYSRHQFRDASTKDGFTPPADRVIEPVASGPTFHKPVAILQGPACVSSNESFLSMMRGAKKAKLFGTPSGGSSGNPRGVPIAPGVTVMVPSWRDLEPDGTCLEGRGVQPDVVVEYDAATPGKDAVLEAALEWLRGKP